VFHVKTITKSGGVVGNFELTPTECLLAKNDDFVASNRRHVVRRSPLTHTGRGLSIFSPWAVTRSGSLPTITSSTIGLTLRRIPDSRSPRESVYLFSERTPRVLKPRSDVLFGQTTTPTKLVYYEIHAFPGMPTYTDATPMSGFLVVRKPSSCWGMNAFQLPPR
jgi:hypothetical protein